MLVLCRRRLFFDLVFFKVSPYGALLVAIIFAVRSERISDGAPLKSSRRDLRSIPLETVRLWYIQLSRG